MIWNICSSCNSPFISIGFWCENEKHKSLSPSAMQVNNWQKKISIEERLGVICQLGKCEQIVDKCHNVSFA
jgi:predicted alpha-1,6-mannanase (GH76 family)